MTDWENLLKQQREMVARNAETPDPQIVEEEVCPIHNLWTWRKWSDGYVKYRACPECHAKRREQHRRMEENLLTGIEAAWKASGDPE